MGSERVRNTKPAGWGACHQWGLCLWVRAQDWQLSMCPWSWDAPACVEHVHGTLGQLLTWAECPTELPLLAPWSRLWRCWKGSCLPFKLRLGAGEPPPRPHIRCEQDKLDAGATKGNSEQAADDPVRKTCASWRSRSHMECWLAAQMNEVGGQRRNSRVGSAGAKKPRTKVAAGSLSRANHLCFWGVSCKA